MTSTSDLGDLARIHYEAGITPLDFAEEQVALLVDMHATIAAEGLGAVFPDLPTGPHDFARRILGALLDAGWEPPVWPIPEPGVPQ
jgi:hypothetical protein